MKARFCPHCGADVSGEYNFCPNCGTRLPEVSDITSNTGPIEAGKIKPENSDSVNQAHVEEIHGESLTVSGDVLICPTCGFQNPLGTKSCESCGSFLKGSEKGPSSKLKQEEKPEPIVDEQRVMEHGQIQAKGVSGKKPRRKETKPQTVEAASVKKIRLSTIQVAAIVAALLLGSIFVYGIVSTKSVAPQQDNTSGGNIQQQTTTDQPSPDVLNEIDRLREVVDKNPSDLVSTLKLSNMLQDNKMYDQASVYYKRYLDKIPDNIDARVDYGVTLYESGHTEDAINELNQAIKMNPKHQKAYFNLGIVYLNAGEIDKSNDALKKCVDIDPQSDVGKQAQQILQQHANIKN